MEPKELSQNSDNEFRTLGDTVYELVSTGRARSPEFEQLINFYGKDKLRKIYRSEIAKRQQPQIKSHQKD
jgi:hypothetical protein